MEQSSDTPATDDAVEAVDGDAIATKKSGLVIKLALFFISLAIGGTAGFAGYDRIATMSYASPEGDTEDPSGPVEYGEFFEIAGMIINPTESVGKRYLMLNIGLEGTAKTVADIETKQIVIRDMVIRELGSRTTEELADITRRDSMKEGLRVIINGVLKEGKVDHLYFTQYVIQ